MYISDDSKLNISPGSSFTTDSVAYVFKTSEDTETTNIGVYCPKLMPALNMSSSGPIESQIKLSNKKIINDGGFGLDEKVISRNWLMVPPLTIMNLTPPTLVPGDIVFIGFIDNDIKSPYYMMTSVDYQGHRKNDKIRLFVPASPEGNTTVTKDNSYYLELNSIDGRIVISTSDADGESTKQQVVLDSSGGVMSLSDGGRMILIEKENDVITIKNEANSAIVMEKDTITLKCKYLKKTVEEKITTESKEAQIDIDNTEFNGDKIKMEHKDIDIKSDNYSSDIKKEEHSVSNLFSVKGNGKTHINHGKIGLNGETIIRNWVIGSVPDINSPVMKTNGDSGPPGTSLWSTGTGAMPLVKYDALSTILINMCTYIDMAMSSGPVPLPPAAIASITPQLSNLATKKIMSS